MAEFTGSAQLGKSVAQLLAASEDPAVIAALLPGCEALHRIDPEHIEGRLSTEVAGIPVTAAVSVRRTVEELPDGVTRLHLRLKVRPDIGGQAVVAALVLGLLNAFLRPLIILLTLPLNIFSLGAFTLVINA